jgi:hypothetical protein
MRFAGGLPRGVAAALWLPLAGCSMLGGMIPQDGDPAHVLEIRRLAVCNSDGPQTRLTLLSDREAVRAWQHAHNVDLVGVDPLPSGGPYVLVELGVRMSAGYGVAVSREAGVSGGTLRLNASLITPGPGQPVAEVVTSPCALIALPPGSYRAAELRDPAGALLARADAAPPVQ